MVFRDRKAYSGKKHVHNALSLLQVCHQTHAETALLPYALGRKIVNFIAEHQGALMRDLEAWKPNAVIIRHPLTVHPDCLENWTRPD
jgi:hypothetical protein